MAVRIFKKHESMLPSTEQFIADAIITAQLKYSENLNQMAGSIVEKLDAWLGGSTWNAIITKSGTEAGFLVQYKPGTCLEAEYEGYDFTIFQAPSLEAKNGKSNGEFLIWKSLNLPNSNLHCNP